MQNTLKRICLDRWLARVALMLALAVVAGIALSARAETIEVNPGDDLPTILEHLGAGDEVIIHSGTYPTGGYLAVTWNGTADSPIVVRAAAGTRPVIQGDPSQNVLNIDGQHFVLQGLAITGGSHGLRLGTVSDARFEDLILHGLGDVGISCNRPDNRCERVEVRDCEIFDTGVGGGPGEAMYLGCNDGVCAVVDSVIESNYIHDIGGSQGDGIELKTGSYGNTIRDNVIIGTQYPGITLYGFPPGAGAHNVVEGNFVADAGDNGIQIVGQVIVRNNIVINSGASGIASKPSQGFTPNDITIVHNTILGAGDTCMRGNEWASSSAQIVANNAFYCEGTTAFKFPQGVASDTVFVGNMYRGDNQGPAESGALGAGVPEDVVNANGWNLYPTAASALLGAADAAHATAVDFNGTARQAPHTVGAYQHTTLHNPGWLPQETFKGISSEPPPPLEDTSPSDTSPGDTASADTQTPSDTSTTTSADTSTTTADTQAADIPSADASGTAADTQQNPTNISDATAADTQQQQNPTNGDDEGCGCNALRTNPTSAPAALLLWAGVFALGGVAVRRRI